MASRRAWRLVLKCVCGATALTSATAICTQFPLSQTSSASAKPKGFFTLTIYDSVSRSTACPAGTANGGKCYLLSEHGHSPQLGAVRVVPVLDVEFPTSPCGTSHRFVEKLKFRLREACCQDHRSVPLPGRDRDDH